MRLTQSLLLGAVATGALQAQAEPSPELLDLAARVHYGYYHGDARAIESAQVALDRLADTPEVLYYRDFAAFRRVQLGATGRAQLERLDACARRTVPPGLPKGVKADAWVLVAACALLADDERRREQALASARVNDDDNPRIALLEAWTLERSALVRPEHRDRYAAKLGSAVEAFDAWTPAIDDPGWGHAEALAALAADALDRGQLRAARDHVERALLLVPEYRTAVELSVALQNGRSRTL